MNTAATLLLLKEAGGLGVDSPDWETFQAEPDLHLVVAGVAGGSQRLDFRCSPQELALRVEGGWSWPLQVVHDYGPQLLKLPLCPPLAHLVLASLTALSAGATEVEIQNAGQRLTLSPTESPRLEPGGTEQTWRAHWPRPTCPEPARLRERCRLSPVPVSVDGEVISTGLSLGPCAVARALGQPPAVQAQPLLSTQSEGLTAWIGLGGAWFLEHGPGVRLYFVVDGLTYTLDHGELGCPDLRAVVIAPLAPEPDLRHLPRDGRLASLLAQVRQQVESAKSEFADHYPLPGPRGTGVINLLRQIVCERRVQGSPRRALDLCQRILADGLEPRHRDFFLEAAAGLATRLEEHVEACHWSEQAVAGTPEGSVARAMRLDSRGVTLLEAGQPQAAQRALEEAEGLKRQLLDEQEPHWVAETLERLTQLCFAQGRYAEAERYAKRAVARTLEGLGERHPAAALALLGTARAYIFQDRLEEAARLAEQARASLTRDPRAEAQALQHQGLVAYLEGDHEAAARFAGEAVLRVHDHPLERLGARLLQGLAAPGPEAAQHLSDCLRGVEAQLGPDHTDAAATRLALARVRLREGQLDRAQQHVARAAEIYAQRWGSRHPARGRALDLDARVHARAGQWEQAETLARLGAEILDRTLSLGDPEEGFRDSAGTLCYRWWTESEDTGCRSPVTIPPWRLGREPEELARAQAHLAKILRALKQNEEADRWAGRALTIRSTRGSASLVREAGGLLRLSPEAIAVRLSLQAPGRVLAWLRLETARGRVALMAEREVPEKDLMLALVEPGRKPLLAGSPLFAEPWGGEPVSFLMYAADQGSSRVSAIPYVVTAGFAEGPCLKIPVRL